MHLKQKGLRGGVEWVCRGMICSGVGELWRVGAICRTVGEQAFYVDRVIGLDTFLPCDQIPDKKKLEGFFGPTV